MLATRFLILNKGKMQVSIGKSDYLKMDSYLSTRNLSPRREAQ
jgi:hypothetical protein